MNDSIYSVIKKFGASTDEWTESVGTNTYMVLAKRTIIGEDGKLHKENILYQNINLDDDIELNPALNGFFYIDNVIGNNLRF